MGSPVPVACATHTFLSTVPTRCRHSSVQSPTYPAPRCRARAPSRSVSHHHAFAPYGHGVSRRSGSQGMFPVLSVRHCSLSASTSFSAAACQCGVQPASQPGPGARVLCLCLCSTSPAPAPQVHVHHSALTLLARSLVHAPASRRCV